MNEFLRILAACEGFGIYGISLVIIGYYLYLPKSERVLKWHIISVALSFCLLVSCTITTIYNWYEHTNESWRIRVVIAYSLADIALTLMLRRVVKKHIEERHKKL